jgi:hypothetical protein
MTLRFDLASLTLFQKATWYLLLSWFLLACAVYPFSKELGTEISFWGVLIVVGATFLRIGHLSEIYRRSGRRGLWLLTWALVLVLIATVATAYF